MKKVIIIGASSGIGNELARILANKNYKVGICARRLDLLTLLQIEKPDAYFVKQVDVTDIDVTSQGLTALVAALGGLDLLIFCTGIGEINTNLDFAIEKNTIETNITGFTFIMDWAFHYFEKQKHGHLTAITSIAGIRGNRQATSYNASKAYQINYLEGLRQRAKNLKTPIFVTDIRPGFVNTAMAKGEGLFWVSSVEKAAAQIFEAICHQKKIAYVTKRWRFIAFLLKITPRMIYDRM